VEHVVFFPAPDGNPAFRRLPSLDDAIRFVEFLSNSENITDVSVHTLSPVQLAVRTVYRVEVVGAEEGAGEAPAPDAGGSVEVVEEVPVPGVEPVAVAVPLSVVHDPDLDPQHDVVAAVAPEASPVDVPSEDAAAEGAEAVAPEAEPMVFTPQVPEQETPEEQVSAGNGTGDVHSLGFFAG
jgi:hypothetical protein